MYDIEENKTKQNKKKNKETFHHLLLFIIKQKLFGNIVCILLISNQIIFLEYMSSFIETFFFVCVCVCVCLIVDF